MLLLFEKLTAPINCKDKVGKVIIIMSVGNKTKAVQMITVKMPEGELMKYRSPKASLVLTLKYNSDTHI